MKQIILILTLLVTLNHTDTVKDIQNRNIYHLQVSEDGKSADICLYPDENAARVSCADDPTAESNLGVIWKNDLNGDGKNDYILSNVDGRCGAGEVIRFYVFIAKTKSLNGFYKVGDFLASSVSITEKRENGFKVLLNHSICVLGNYLRQFERWAYVKYDPKTLMYKTELETTNEDGSINTICQVDSWPESMISRKPLASIDVQSSPVPSFNCGKAGTQVEKMICSDGAITKLDIYLEASFKAAKNAVVDSMQGKLLTDQRTWLKQRNACKTGECLTNAYRTRLDELCNHYSIRSETYFACYPAP